MRNLASIDCNGEGIKIKHPHKLHFESFLIRELSFRYGAFNRTKNIFKMHLL